MPGAVVAAGGLAEEPGAVAAAACGAALQYRPPCQAPFVVTPVPAAAPAAIVAATGVSAEASGPTGGTPLAAAASVAAACGPAEVTGAVTKVQGATVIPAGGLAMVPGVSSSRQGASP